MQYNSINKTDQDFPFNFVRIYLYDSFRFVSFGFHNFFLAPKKHRRTLRMECNVYIMFMYL